MSYGEHRISVFSVISVISVAKFYFGGIKNESRGCGQVGACGTCKA